MSVHDIRSESTKHLQGVLVCVQEVQEDKDYLCCQFTEKVKSDMMFVCR